MARPRDRLPMSPGDSGAGYRELAARARVRARRHSRRVRRAVAGGHGPIRAGTRPPEPGDVQQLVDESRVIDRPPVKRARGPVLGRREWAQHSLTQLRTHDPAKHGLLNAMLARYSGNDLRAPEDGETHDLPRRVAPLRVPTLIVGGQLDLATRIRAADELATTLAAERTVLAGAGHLSSLDCAIAYSRCCREFLAQYTP